MSPTKRHPCQCRYGPQSCYRPLCIYLPFAGRDAFQPLTPFTQYGGRLNGMVADGRYAYAGIGPRLLVLDAP